MPTGTRTIREGYPIGLDNIATEFRRPISNVKLGDYYLENLADQPLNTTVNMKVPFGPVGSKPISVGDFYGAAWYQGSFSCYGRGESYERYHRANDAALYFKFDNCSSPSIRIIIGNSTFNYYGDGLSFSIGWVTVPIGDCESTVTFPVQFTDCRGTWYRSLTIGFNSGTTAVQTVDTRTDLTNFNPQIRV